MADLRDFIPQAVQPNASPNWSALDQLLSRPTREAEDKRRFEEENTRANAHLKIQQDYQGRKFAKEDQAEIEGLLSELQAAQDQGDSAVHERVLQKLQRFGLDVGKPDLQALTGQKPGRLSTQGLPDLKALTGESRPAPLSTQGINLRNFTGQGPDEVVQRELASREALKGRNAEPEQDLPQGEFEEQLINSTQGMPERFERSGALGGEPGTTPEFKARVAEMTAGAPDEPEVVDMGDVDSPEFVAAAAAEKPKPLATQGLPAGQRAPEAPGRAENPARPLSTQLGGNIISKGGRVLATESMGGGRSAPIVAQVFDQFTQSPDAQVAQLAKEAQQFGARLMSVDGMSQQAAIKEATDFFQKRLGELNGLRRTELGANPRRKLGGGASTGVLGPKDDRAESIDKYGDNIEQAIQHSGIPASEEKLTAAENAIMSDDPALQKDAIKALLQARSGLTVSEGERRSYAMMDGAFDYAKNTISGWTGQPISEQTRKSILAIIQNMRKVHGSTKKQITDREVRRYKAQNKDKVAGERLDERARALSGEDPGEYGGL